MHAPPTHTPHTLHTHTHKHAHTTHTWMQHGRAQTHARFYMSNFHENINSYMHKPLGGQYSE